MKNPLIVTLLVALAISALLALDHDSARAKPWNFDDARAEVSRPEAAPRELEPPAEEPRAAVPDEAGRTAVAANETPVHGEPPAPEVPARSRREMMEERQRTVLDIRASAEDRSLAFRLLSMHAVIDHEELRTPEVLEEAFTLIAQASDEDLRADTMGGFKGVRDHAVVPRLIALLESDGNHDVRKMAALLLREHPGHPATHAALRRAYEQDEDEEVRATASKGL